MQTHANPENLDIYLLIGQSNMAGRADITDDLRDPIPGVYLYRGNGQELWVAATNPLNRYSTIRKELSMQNLGPGYGFAQAMRRHAPERELGLVVNARGGTAVSSWLPGTEYFEEAVRRTREASGNGTLRGILWHQGESDLALLDSYPDHLERMITGLREAFGNPDLPFAAGQLSEDVFGAVHFNELILELPGRVHNTAVVRSSGTTTFDYLHFDTASQLRLGERYAEALLSLSGNR